MLDLGHLPSLAYEPPAIYHEIARSGVGPFVGVFPLIASGYDPAVISRFDFPSQTPRSGETPASRELTFRLPDSTRLECLRGLDEYFVEGWDSEGAAPVSTEAIVVAQFVLGLLPPHAPNPDVAVGVDGSLCMEWHRVTAGGDSKLFLDLGPMQKTLIYMRDGDRPPFEAHPLWNTTEFLLRLVEVVTSFFGRAPQAA